MKNKIKITDWNFDVVTLGVHKTIFYRWSEEHRKCYVRVVISFNKREYEGSVYLKNDIDWERKFKIVDDDLSSLKFRLDIFIFNLGFLPDISPKNYK